MLYKSSYNLKKSTTHLNFKIIDEKPIDQLSFVNLFFVEHKSRLNIEFIEYNKSSLILVKICKFNYSNYLRLYLVPYMMQINTFSHRLLSAHDRLCVLHVMFCSEIQLFRSLNDFYNRQHFVLQYGNFIERWKEIEFRFYFAILFPSDRQSSVWVFLVYWKIFWLMRTTTKSLLSVFTQCITWECLAGQIPQ